MSALRDTHSNSRVKQGQGPRLQGESFLPHLFGKHSCPRNTKRARMGLERGRENLSLIAFKIRGFW